MTPLPGDFGLVTTFGNLLDREVAKIIQWDTESPFNHAVLCKDDATLIEAAPGGARERPLTTYDDITWSTGKIALTDQQRTAIVAAGESYVAQKIGYGYLDFAAIAFEQARWHDDHDDVKDYELLARLASMHRMICSALVDAAYLSAGVHLFSDGRPQGLVSPGDLGRLLAAA